jgi:uncharacterized DUF497 family protein
MNEIKRDFEWDTDKGVKNEQKHGVDFLSATRVFADPVRFERLDAAHSGSEERWITIGYANPGILTVVHTERNRGTIRIISARKATKNEQKTYYQNQGRSR